MTKKFFPCFLLVFLSFPLWGGGKSRWEVFSVSEINCDIWHSAMEGPDFGVSGGHYGHIHRTVDGGNSWQEMEQALGIGGRTRFEIVGDRFALSTGNRGMAVTRDGGNTWEKWSSESFSHISFSLEDTGWMVRDGLWLRTNQGLDAWEEVLPPENCGNVQSLSAVSHDLAWVWDREGLLFRTGDGGHSWESLDILPLLQEQGYTPQPGLAILRFNERNQGILVIMDRKEAFRWLICETRDGGNTWQVETLQRERNGTIYISHDLNYITLMETVDRYPVITLFERR